MFLVLRPECLPANFFETPIAVTSRTLAAFLAFLSLQASIPGEKISPTAPWALITGFVRVSIGISIDIFDGFHKVHVDRAIKGV